MFFFQKTLTVLHPHLDVLGLCVEWFSKRFQLQFWQSTPWILQRHLGCTKLAEGVAPSPTFGPFFSCRWSPEEPGCHGGLRAPFANFSPWAMPAEKIWRKKNEFWVGDIMSQWSQDMLLQVWRDASTASFRIAAAGFVKMLHFGESACHEWGVGHCRRLQGKRKLEVA